MADLISRAAAIAKVEKARKAARTLTGMDFVMMLKDQPAVDAAPVVRCWKCKYWKDQSETPKWLPCSEIQTNGNWFCADGKQRDDDAAD